MSSLGTCVPFLIASVVLVLISYPLSLDSIRSGLGACLFGKTGYSSPVQGKLLAKRGWRGKRLEKPFSRIMGDGF